MFTPVNLVLIIIGFIVVYSNITMLFATVKAGFRSILPMNGE